MTRKHIALISALIAVAAIAGLFGVLRTTSLASSGSQGATDALVQARTKQLDAVERQLRSQVAQLDAPAAQPAPVTTAGTATAAGTLTAGTNAAGEKVVYVRPAPIVRTVHRAGGGEQGEAGEHEGSSYEHGEGEDD